MKSPVRIHFCSFDRDCQEFGERNDRINIFIGRHYWYLDLLRWKDRGYYPQPRKKK